jgi:hypothetical protein
MRHFSLLLATLLTGLLTAAGAVPALAGNLQVRGLVSKNCTVKVNDQGANINMAAGASNLQVATIGETCNADDGYTITLSSAFSGALSGGNGQKSAYTLSYDTVENTQLDSPVVLNHTKDQREEVNKALRVTVPPNSKAAQANARFYDTITISIAAR